MQQQDAAKSQPNNKQTETLQKLQKAGHGICLSLQPNCIHATHACSG
jgi:hypothetical protein